MFEDSEVNDPGYDLSDELNDFISDDTAGLKPGVKLPRNESQWMEANLYFRAELPICDVNANSINECVIKMSNLVYDYFAENFGTVTKKSVLDDELDNKYTNYTKQELKRELKALKRQSNADVNNIKYVSRLLRNLSSKKKSTLNSYNDNKLIKQNFWRYAKMKLKSGEKLLATFSLSSCTNYFISMWKKLLPMNTFTMPDWIPSLPSPTHKFNSDPPTYARITSIIRKMKSNGSACPLDQFSIILLKKSAYLRSYLTVIIQNVWKSGVIQDVWKKAVTLLIHKKDSPADAINFRPIIMHSIPLKIFMSVLPNTMYEFLFKNNFIENSIQKGFTPGMSGTFEHTAHLAFRIKQAKKQQHSLAITLLDLKNAFGEVHHRLIPTVLQYHHIPEHFRKCVENAYSDFYLSVVTEAYQTPFMKVKKGVLQGCCLSPLLFNMLVNTYIQYIKSERFTELSFTTSHPLLRPKHWFQFAGDAAITTSKEYETKILLNAFTAWCSWAKMTLLIEKCKTFGMCKLNTTSTQTLPKLYLNQKMIPTVSHNESFCYLGHYYNFAMDNSDHKQLLYSETKDILEKIDQL